VAHPARIADVIRRGIPDTERRRGDGVGRGGMRFGEGRRPGRIGHRRHRHVLGIGRPSINLHH
ncbi:hypothetical protein ACSTLC_24380, partial [Vibrio parahaemolyticus]